MQRWRGYDAAPSGWGRSAITIGVFDGVHRGHQEIIGHTVKRARDLGVQSVVVTFDPHPAEVVRPGSHPAVLTAAALGRPHRVEGVVVRGDQRGRELGFPTANLLCSRYAAIPADGVYAAWLVRRSQRHMAAVSIGTNPTFSGRERRVEAYALDFDGDLYGERLAVDFVAWLREMRSYDGLEPLTAQISQDVTDTR